MATAMATVYIVRFGGKTLSINFPVSTFWRTKISELQYQVQLKTGVMVESQRLVFVTKDLQSQRDGVDMTFGDYSISGNSSIMLIIRLPGGGGPGFIPLSFTDITSEDKFKPIEFTPTAPDWGIVKHGLNFQGICKKRTCKANNKSVMVPKGFYDSTNGQCMFNYEISQLECPMCRTKLDKRNVSGVGIYKCKLQVKAKRESEDEICFKMKSTDKFRFAKSLNEDDKIDYEYIILTVKRL